MLVAEMDSIPEIKEACGMFYIPLRELAREMAVAYCSLDRVPYLICSGLGLGLGLGLGVMLSLFYRSVPARNSHQAVKFKVRDKDHVLGVVVLNLNSLGSHREPSKQWLSLVPYKKGHETAGELLVECFASQHRPGHVVSLSEASSPILSRVGSQEDMLNPRKGKRFSIHRRTPSWTKGLSGNVETKRLSGGVDGYLGPSSISRSESATSDISSKPQVTGISPHEGPVQGGQRVVLRGSNLGENKESVLKILVADMDCTNSLEYFCQSKF